MYLVLKRRFKPLILTLTREAAAPARPAADRRGAPSRRHESGGVRRPLVGTRGLGAAAFPEGRPGGALRIQARHGPGRPGPFQF